jgi:hypothetical protein
MDIGGRFNISKFVTITVAEDPISVDVGLINMPPFFDKPVPTQVFDLSQGRFSIQLPDILDGQDNFEKIKISSSIFGELEYTLGSLSDSEHIAYDEDLKKLTFILPEGDKGKQTGKHVIQITLVDAEGAENEEEIEVVMVNPSNMKYVVEEEIIDTVLEENPLFNMTAKFIEINQYGVAKIQFSE